MSNLLGIGLEPKGLDSVQVCLRAVIVFLATLVMVRVANRRFMARLTPFDTVLGFIMASMLARAINGSAALWPTLAGGFALVLLHALLSLLSFHFGWFGHLVKGAPDLVVEQGQPNHKALRAHKISEADLYEELRLQGNIGSLDQVKRATMERNGKISVVPK